MDLKELIAFQTIVQEGTFSRAAEKLNYAQSTITNQIQRLEKELGIQLFKRGWDVELTEAGRRFASEIQSLIAHWNHVADLARDLQQDEVGELRVGGIESAIDGVLPAALRKFGEQKPRMDCHVVAGNTEFLAQALVRDELDFAICGEPSDPAAFRFEALYREEMIFVADRLHPLHGQDTVNSASFEDLLRYPIVAGGSTCLYALQFAKRLSRYAITPPVQHTVSRISAIPRYVQHTQAVGVVLASTPLIPEVGRIGATVDMPPIPVGLLQLREREDAVTGSQRLLAQLVKEAAMPTQARS